MPKARLSTIPLLLFFLSLILRLLLISKGPYHLDCLSLALRSQETLATGELQYLFGSGYPMAVILGAVFQLLCRLFSVDDPVFAVNLMGVIFGALCIPANYSVAKKLFDGTTAVLSSILLSITPIFFGVSVYGMSHAPALFFLLTGISSFLTYLKTGSMRRLVLAGILIGLSGATRFQDLILMIIPLCFLFFKETEDTQHVHREGKATTFTLAAIIAGSTAIVFHLPFLLQTKSSSHYSNQFSDFFHLMSSNYRGLFSGSLLPTAAYLEISFTFLGIAAALGGFLMMKKKNPRVLGFLLLWFIVPLAFYGNLYTSVSRFLVVLLPPLLIAQGYLFSRLLGHRVLKNAVLPAFGLIVFLSFNNIFPIVLFRHQNELLVDFARWLGEHTEPNARIITITDHEPFIEYYGHRKALRRPTDEFKLDPVAMEDFRRELDKALNDGAPVYITSPGLYAYDPDQQFSHYFEGNYKIELIGRKPVEDWYRGCILQRVGPYSVYTVERREPINN